MKGNQCKGLYRVYNCAKLWNYRNNNSRRTVEKGEFHRLIGLYKIDNDCNYFSNSIYQIFRLLHGEHSANHFIFIKLINPSNNPGKVLLSFFILQIRKLYLRKVLHLAQGHSMVNSRI